MQLYDWLYISGYIDTLFYVYFAGLLLCVAVFSVIAGMTQHDSYKRFVYMAERFLASLLWPAVLFVLVFLGIGMLIRYWIPINEDEEDEEEEDEEEEDEDVEEET